MFCCFCFVSFCFVCLGACQFYSTLQIINISLNVFDVANFSRPVAMLALLASTYPGSPLVTQRHSQQTQGHCYSNTTSRPKATVTEAQPADPGPLLQQHSQQTQGHCYSRTASRPRATVTATQPADPGPLLQQKSQQTQGHCYSSTASRLRPTVTTADPGPLLQQQ